MAGRPHRAELTQTARFKPKGLTGLAYWFAVLPLHGIVFRGMLDGIRRAAEDTARGEGERRLPDANDVAGENAGPDRPDRIRIVSTRPWAFAATGGEDKETE